MAAFAFVGLASAFVSSAADSVSEVVSALALAFVLFLAGAGASDPTASLAASSASLAACAMAASSVRWRSVLACSSAFLADLAALLPPTVMSATRRRVSSWR